MTEQDAVERLKCMRLFMQINDDSNDSKFLEDDYIANDMAIKALEKQIPKKPIHFHEEYDKHEWKKDRNGKIDLFAWGYGYCNGPVCERCGESPCEHCNPDYDDEKCIVDRHTCPVCGKKVWKHSDKNYCQCGQKLDWSDEDDI